MCVYVILRECARLKWDPFAVELIGGKLPFKMYQYVAQRANSYHTAGPSLHDSIFGGHMHHHNVELVHDEHRLH